MQRIINYNFVPPKMIGTKQFPTGLLPCRWWAVHCRQPCQTAGGTWPLEGGSQAGECGLEPGTMGE